MAAVSDLIQIGLDARKASFLGDTFASAITLTGASQATGVPIVDTINRITGGTSPTDIAATLPQVVAFKPTFLVIKSQFIGFNAEIYPGVGDQINGLGADVPISLTAGKTMLFFKISSTEWIAFEA